jgi:hypothetical protein
MVGQGKIANSPISIQDFASVWKPCDIPKLYFKDLLKAKRLIIDRLFQLYNPNTLKEKVRTVMDIF